MPECSRANASQATCNPSIAQLVRWLAISLFAVGLTGLAWAAPSLSVIYSFTGQGDGSQPQGALLLDASGALFGVTAQGGASGNGVVFKLTPPTNGGDWTESVLHSFSGSDGATPAGGLLARAGVLYGVTTNGGASGKGTVFQLKLNGSVWTETVLHSFSGTDGANPTVRLVADAKGALYGITFAGGTSNAGVVFKLTPPSAPGGTWKETVILNLTGSGGGAFGGVLVIDKSGALYSTQSSPDQVFKLTPPSTPGAHWTFTVLHNDAATFITADSVDNTGTLFGTTLGPNAFFELSPSGDEKVLVEMGDIYPLPGLAAGPGGAFYGGNFGRQVFKLTPPSQTGGDWTVGFVIPDCFNDGMPTVDKSGTIYGYSVGICGPRDGAVYRLTQ